MTWTGYRLERSNNGPGPESAAVGKINAGRSRIVLLTIKAPTTSGVHRTSYQLRGSQGQAGVPVHLDLDVRTKVRVRQ